MIARIFLCDSKYAVSRFTNHLKNTLCINVLWMFIFVAGASLLFNFSALLKPWMVGMMMLECSHCLTVLLPFSSLSASYRLNAVTFNISVNGMDRSL